MNSLRFAMFIVVIGAVYVIATCEWIQSIAAPHFADRPWFGLFEAFIASLFVWSLGAKAVSACRRWDGATEASVERGDRSWGYVGTAWAILSLIAVHIVNSTSAADGHKTAFHIMNLFVLYYLVFFDDWFRQIIITQSQIARNR